MVRRVVIIDVRPAPCALCGERAELRPYGPGNALICHPCMGRDEAACKARMYAFLEEADEIYFKEGERTVGMYLFENEVAR